MVNWHKTGPDFGVVFTMTASGQRGRLIKAGGQMGRFVYPGHFGKSLCNKLDKLLSLTGKFTLLC